MLFVIVEVKSSDMESKSAPILTHAVVVFCTWYMIDIRQRGATTCNAALGRFILLSFFKPSII